MRSVRFGVTATVLALLVAACGGGTGSSEPPATTTPVSSTTAAQGEPAVETPVPQVASENGESNPTTTDARPAPDPSREIAPDFSLALADGSTFVLSEETRPVFMVFWAEW